MKLNNYRNVIWKQVCVVKIWHHNLFREIPLVCVEVDLKIKLPPFIYACNFSRNLGCFIVGFMSEITLDPPSNCLEILSYVFTTISPMKHSSLICCYCDLINSHKCLRCTHIHEFLWLHAVFYLKECPGSFFEVFMGLRHTQNYPWGQFNPKDFVWKK